MENLLFFFETIFFIIFYSIKAEISKIELLSKKNTKSKNKELVNKKI